MIKVTDRYGSFSLDDVEIGDKLMVRHPHGWNTFRFEPVTVTKVMKTKITTSDNRQWSRKNKEEYGAGNSAIELRAHNEQVINEANEEIERDGLAFQITSTSCAKLRQMPIEILKQIVALLPIKEDKS